MHEPPADFSEAELISVLREHWRLPASDLEYLPVGFGGFHWRVTSRAGRRWFATASRLGSDHDFADLSGAMATAVTLAGRGLRFVLAPVPTASGQPVARPRPDYAITLFPFASGRPGQWGEVLTPADQNAVAGILAELHATTGDPGVAPVRPLELAGAGLLDESIRERGRSWRGGPFSEPARQLLSDHAAGLAGALARFRDLAASLSADGRAPVLTHGEPHSGNLIRRGAGFLLIDWDTAGLAPPERDLWWLVPGSGDAARRYAELTGRAVSMPAVTFYRLRWDLDDISSFLAEFRRAAREDAGHRGRLCRARRRSPGRGIGACRRRLTLR